MSSKSWFALSLMILMLGIVAVSSFGAVTVSLEQLSVYNPDNHYGTAIRRGTADVPILKITVTSNESADVTFTELRVQYTGPVPTDIGTYADLHNSSGLVSTRSISGGIATFPLSETIPAGGIVPYTVKLDIASGAGSNRIKLGFQSASFAGIPNPVTTATLTNPDAISIVDASPPVLDLYPTAIPNKYHGEYNTGTKILKLKFYDGTDPIGSTTPKVKNPLVRLVWTDAIDGTPVPQVDLSKIQLRAPDDAPTTNLSGATLLWPGPKVGASDLVAGFYTANGTKILYLPTLPGDGFLDPGDEFPAGASAFNSEVWIRLNSTQDANFQNNILPDSSTIVDAGYKVMELYINGALWDAGAAFGSAVNPDTNPNDADFKNLIAEKVDARILIIGDTTPPALVGADGKPVKFNSVTRVLTLSFTESINATPRTEVSLSKIHIMNHRFDFDEVTGEVVIVEDENVNLANATVTESYGTIVTITLTGDHRDVLKGEHPQLYFEAGAVKDISGNGVLAMTPANAVDVLVTPPLLSGVETLYDGDLPSPVEFDLVFSEEISTVVATKIAITNEKDESPFYLTTSEFDTIVIKNSIARVANFNISKAHRDKIAEWQHNGLLELRVRLDNGAVVDAYGTSNDASPEGENIGWDKDNVGPVVTNSSTYISSTRLLSLNFNENLNLTPEADQTIADLVNSSLITLSPVGGTGAVVLTNDELLPNQPDGWWLKYTLTTAHNDEISKWKIAGAVQIEVSVLAAPEGVVPAVQDINGNLALDTNGVIYSSSWVTDTVRPTFVAAYYSVTLRTLVIRFSESVANAQLGKMRVHAAGKGQVALTGTVNYYGDVLKVIGLDDTAHNAIAAVGNPQIDLGTNTSDHGAVSDLSGNLLYATLNRSISYDSEGPSLSLTGNIYEHIWVETPEGNDPNNQGQLTLTFNEVIDVRPGYDLGKIMLGVGTIRFPLSGEELLTTADSSVIKIKITDDAVVGGVAGLQSEYDLLYVELEAGAVEDLAGNPNLAKSQGLNTWIGDTKKPELDYTGSYYRHTVSERGVNYARLALKFNELMDTRAAYINFSGIVVADSAGNSITLTSGELKPNQEALSYEILFNLTDDHRDVIADWGKVGYGGLGRKELYIYLAEDSVSDRAGNSVALKPVGIFAVAKTDDAATTGVDERQYIATNPASSTWEKDLTPPKYVSSTYNANNKTMTITFDEWMDQAPPDATTLNASKITIKDKDEGNPVVLAVAAYTEQAKTKTVIFTLTPEKDVAVKALADPLYMYLYTGVAVDYSGVPYAAVPNDTSPTKQKITYTKDTTKPTLVVSDDTAGSMYDHISGDLLDSADDRGILTLYFSEGVDKNYDSIDATKIRLSNMASGGGFALTQAEILKAAGLRVYPLAASLVNQIQFDLNPAHWDVIAKEKWGTLYIQMDAGAVKDTSGNAIAAVSAAMGAGRYHTDTTPPDVRLPEAPISSAPVGRDLTITATVTDDIQTQEVRLYYQVGGAVRTYINMTASGSTYTGTIPGTTVTNKGLCYYVWATDQAGNENITGNGNIKTRKGNLDEWHYTSIPGGFPVTVTSASATLPANTLPVFDAAAVPSAYRMLAVPITASPSTTTLFAPFGTAGVDWQAWKFTGGSENNGYQAGHTTPFTFEPARGVAAWVGTVNPDKALTVTGNTSQISNFYHQSDVAGKRYLYEITLHAGWNQVGIPFNFSRNWDRSTISSTKTGGMDDISDRIYWFTGDKSAYGFASLDATVPNQDVFATSWKGSGIPDNGLVWNGWPGSLDPWGGYWIYSNRESAKLYIDPTVPGKGVLPVTPTAPSVEMPYNWSVKVMPEAGGVFGTAKFAGIVSDATDGIDKYDVMDLPALPGQIARLSFITEAGDYLQDMKVPADEMFWNFKVNSVLNTPVTLRFDASAVPAEYRTVLLIDTVTEAATDLRKVSSYVYKPSDTLRNFKLIISKAHIETYIVPKQSVLLQNYPNPFNPETWVPYRLSTAGDVAINIYNVAGQLIRTLELGHREAGSYTVKERAAYWDGRNATGERVASGVYFYNIQSGSFHAIKRMVIVK